MTSPNYHKTEWKVCVGCKRFVLMVNRYELCERCTDKGKAPPPINFVAFMDEIAPVSQNGKVLKKARWLNLKRRIDRFYDTIPPQSRLLWNASIEEKTIRAKAPISKGGFIYLIKSENGYYKVGRTYNVEMRLSQHEMDYPMKLRVIHSFASDNVVKDERRLLRAFGHKQLRGEWFQLETHDIRWFKSIKDHALSTAFATFKERKALFLLEDEKPAEKPKAKNGRFSTIAAKIGKTISHYLGNPG